jgi:phage shock protein C
MKTRPQQSPRNREDTYYDAPERLDLDAISDEELEHLVFEEERETNKGFFNLPTIAGFSMILVGIAYIFQKLGWTGLDVSVLATMLPWLAGILIILLGFGVLSWRPRRKKKVKKAIEMPSGREKVVIETAGKRSKRLRKSRDKKLAGVAAGLAEYLNVGPTLVRIAFVIATIMTQGGALLVYFVLSFLMDKPEPLSADDRITIIRDS